MTVIQTRGLTKDFGAHRGIFDLDLSIPAGQVHGFLGPNGAGKTTTIRLLLGFLRPDHGHARILGKDPTVEAAGLKEQIGYIPGELALPEMLTGQAFLEQSAGLRGGVDRDHRQHLVDQLDAEPDVRIGELSKGNRQKIALIDALQHRPSVLILDEPTDGLDPLLRHQVREILRDHADAGGTVFLSSHIVHEIQTMCDDVSIVIDGELRVQARIKDLLADEGVVVEATVDEADTAVEALSSLDVEALTRQGDRVRFRVHGDPLPALGMLDRLGARDPILRQGDLEQTFLRLFRGEAP